MHSLSTHTNTSTLTWLPLEMSLLHKQIHKHHLGIEGGSLERFLLSNLNANWKLIALDILMGKAGYKQVIT